MFCDVYEDDASCVADSYNAAANKDPRAQCWWQAELSAFTVGPAVALTGLYESSGPISTSQNLEINDDRTLKVLDNQGAFLALGLGMDMLALTKRQVLQVKDESGVAKPWEDMPKPLPDGYSIYLNGACADNLDFSFSDFMGIDCEAHAEAACAQQSGGGSSSGGAPTSTPTADSRGAPSSAPTAGSVTPGDSPTANSATSLAPATTLAMLWLIFFW